MTIRTWTSPADLAEAPMASPLASRDEFGPDVAKAIAELRTAHGIDSPSCQHAGNAPMETDRLRQDLSQMLPGVNRRGFLRLTGAAAVFTLAGCQEKHPDTLVPYAVQPEGTTLGNANWYSTVLRDSGEAVPVMVKVYDGRPIKVEGNPDSPLTKGRADVRTQAALLNLYDPDRLQSGPQKSDGQAFAKTTWSDLDAAVGASLTQGGVALLTGPVDGPATKALLAELSQAFAGRFVHGVWDPVGRDVLQYRLEKAEILVTLGSDLLGGGTSSLADQVGFGALRRARGEGAERRTGQVIAFEATLSQTGAMADVRVRVAQDRVAYAAWGIAELVAKELGAVLPAAITASLDQVRQADLATSLGLKPVNGASPLAFTAERLLACRKAGRQSVIYVGGLPNRGPAGASLHAAAEFLNTILGNDGITVLAGSTQVDAAPVLAALAAGTVQTLIVSGTNPGYSLPGFAALATKAKTVVVLSDRLDETAQSAQWVAPSLHGLETWGDAELVTGVFALQQPTILPLWDARAAEESLMAFAAAAGVAAFKTAPHKLAPLKSVVSRADLWQAGAVGVRSWRDQVKAVWLASVKPLARTLASDSSFWTSALSVGVVGSPVESRPTAAAQAVSLAAFSTAGYQLVVSASRALRDGAWANNPWLHEVPDPVSKITWDNYLAVSPADAEREQWSDGDVVEVTAGSAKAKLPIHIQDGQHPGTLETFFGWGRHHAGAVADLTAVENGGFGVDVVPFIGQASATVAKTVETYVLANVQGHHRLDGREQIAQEVTVGAQEVGHGHHAWINGTDGKPGGRLNLWGASATYPGSKWGMTVDLNTCTGCNACVVACATENNVPVVGRDEVRKNREMHWIAIHRYYRGADRLDVDVIQQPVMCQHCDNAPCEVVCPANATMHSNEGVNLQIYNRCIGTRYCANNCPYKVRRFNWYEYASFRAGPQNSENPLTRATKNITTSGTMHPEAELAHAPLQMMFNPDVTVRSKGVMEKCTFCVQRTREVRDLAKRSGAKVKDGTVTSACAQTCPTQAITFGDLNDPFSAVVQNAKAAEAEGLAYGLLDVELNTRPAVTYFKRLRHRPEAAASHDHAAPAQGGAHS